MQTEQTYSLDEICALVDMPKRTVRYYIQNGLLDRPEGLNRGAKYNRSHLEKLLFIRKWQQAGLSLERIQELISSPEHDKPPARRRGPGTVEVWSHLVVSEGLELHVEPSQAGLSPEQLRAFLKLVNAAYESISKQSGDREEAE
jgi:DNA-binding transcriptional MerR regulator